MGSQRMRALVGVCLALPCLLLLGGCGGTGARVSTSAVKQLTQVVGGDAATTVSLNADEVSRLARSAGVSDEIIEDAAAQLDSQTIWQRSLTGVRNVYEQTPEEVRSNLVGLACDVLQGDISTLAEFEASVYERFEVYGQDELLSILESVYGLYQDLEEASRSGDEERAAAAVTCFTVEELVG